VRKSSDRFEALYVLAIATGLPRDDLLWPYAGTTWTWSVALFILGKALGVPLLERDFIQNVPESPGASQVPTSDSNLSHKWPCTGTFSPAWIHYSSCRKRRATASYKTVACSS
jgi:hypothetical protein